jgi:transposase-like protein
MPRPRKPASPFRYFNSSPEVIRLVVLMYVRFPLSLRNVEDLLFERGIDICHETVRLWWNRFGLLFAGDIRRQRVNRMRGFRHWRWHLDEMYVKLNGEMVYLWRAVDHEGEVLESYITKSRDKSAALRFMKKALKRHGSPDAITTDGLRSYGAAMDETGLSRTSGDRPLGEQPGGKQPSAVSTKGAGNAEVQADEDAAKIRFRPRQRPQSLQPRTPSHRPTDLQGTTLHRAGGVADPCKLDRHVQRSTCIV